MEFRDKYAFLSNMYSSRICIDGDWFPCVETAFQIAKCKYRQDRDLFLNRSGRFVNGTTAKKIGREVELRDDWEKAKPWVMYEAVRAKFQIPEFKEALLATRDEYLCEDNSWGDTYWGKCNGIGQNMLGRIIMHVRKELRGEV